MFVRTFIECAMLLPPEHSCMLRGPHGIGKSQVVRLIAKKLGLPVIDRRLSQMSEGDVIGLPSTTGNMTRFNPPDWYHRACNEPVVLFLDELNRATPEVMQAAFQIVLDRELNGHKLHPQTRVFTAINNSASYNVNQVDPALLDRFWVVDINPDTKDWLAWARNTDAENGGGNIHPTITDFLAGDEKWLDPPKNAEPDDVHPSRRSWERVNKALVGANVIEDPKNSMFYSLSMGFLGPEASIAFQKFAESVDNRVSGEEICTKYDKVKAKINRLGQEKLNIAIEKAADYLLKQTKWTEKHGENMRKFMEDLDGELRIAFWSKITKDGVDKMELAQLAHKHCAKLILDVFGVPMGEAGVGVVPNIPGVFRDQNTKK